MEFIKWLLYSQHIEKTELLKTDWSTERSSVRKIERERERKGKSSHLVPLDRTHFSIFVWWIPTYPLKLSSTSLSQERFLCSQVTGSQPGYLDSLLYLPIFPAGWKVPWGQKLYLCLHVFQYLARGSAHFFFTGPDSKHIRLCRTYGVCLKYCTRSAKETRCEM